MGYDWERIFKNKTNKELYDIVTGEVILSKDAVEFARKELENRNFNFSNMEANEAVWQVSRLIVEEDYYQSEVSGRIVNYISLKILPIIILVISLFYYGINNMTAYKFPIEMAFIFAGLATLFVLFNNYQHGRQKQAQLKRIAKIKKIKEKLDKENLLEKDGPIHKELIRQRKKESKGIKTISYIAIVVSVVILLTYLLKRFL